MYTLYKSLKKNEILVAILVVFVIVFGVFSFSFINKREFPVTAIPIISVTYHAPGYNAKDSNDLILKEIEDATSDINNIFFTTGVASDNGGNISYVFPLDVLDISIYQEEIEDRIKGLNFDDSITFEYLEIINESHAVYIIDKDLTIEDTNIIYEHLNQIENVREIKISGIEGSYISVETDLDKLLEYQITYTQFLSLLEDKTNNLPLGYLTVDGKKVPFSNNNYINDINQLKDIVLLTTPYGDVTIDDVAVVELVENDEEIYIHNEEEVALLSLYFEDGVDHLRTGNDVTPAIEALQEDGYDIETFLFQPEVVKTEIDKIIMNLLQSIAIVFIVILFGLGLRNSLIVSLNFPFSIFFSIIMLYVLGLDIQKISISGLIISIGILVDNSVVVVESIQKYLNRGYTHDEAIKRTYERNFVPLLFSTITTILVFVPFLTFSGIAGEITRTLPITVIFAMISSFVFSMAVIPLIARKICHKSKKQTNDYLLISKKVSGLIKKPVLVVTSLTLLLIASGIGAFYVSDIELFPTAEKNLMYIEYSNVDDYSYETTIEYNQEILDYVKEVDYMEPLYVSSLSAVSGQIPQYYATNPTVKQADNQGYILIELSRNNDLVDAQRALKKELKLEFEDELLINVGILVLDDKAPDDDIIVNVQNSDMNYLGELTNEITAKISEIDGVYFTNNQLANQTSKIEVEYNDDFINQNYLSKSVIAYEIAMLVNNKNLDVVRNVEIDNDVVITSGVVDIPELLNTVIVLNDKPYQLSQLVTLKEVDDYTYYYTRDFKTSANINVSTDGDIKETKGEIDKIINDLDSEIEYKYLDETVATDMILQELVTAFAMALVVISIVLLIQFKKPSNLFIILTAIPMAFIGSFLAIMITGTPIGFTTCLSLIALTGIVVNNSILLINYMKESEEEDLFEACLHTIDERFKPILISNVTTILGLTPLYIFGGDFFGPMALVLIGGLITGTLFTIIVVPSLYYAFNKGKND